MLSSADGGTDDPSELGQHVGLSDVDERLRSVFGDQYGLVVETTAAAPADLGQMRVV